MVLIFQLVKELENWCRPYFAKENQHRSIFLTKHEYTTACSRFQYLSLAVVQSGPLQHLASSLRETGNSIEVAGTPHLQEPARVADTSTLFTIRAATQAFLSILEKAETIACHGPTARISLLAKAGRLGVIGTRVCKQNNLRMITKCLLIPES